jgi:hypothetical protein
VLDFFKHNDLFRGKRAAGLSIRFMPDDSVEYSITCLLKQKDDIQIERSFIVKDKLSKALEQIDVNVPLFISLTGKGILFKKLNYSTPQQAVHEILPNASLQHFYMNKYNVDEENAYISIARKEKVDEILNEIIQRSFYIHNISLGPFDLQHLLAIISHSELKIPGYHISITNQQIEKLTANIAQNENSENIKIGDLTVEPEKVVAFSSAFKYYLSNSEDEKDLIAGPTLNTDEFYHKNIFRIAGWGILVLFFLVLLLNFVFYFRIIV